MKLLTYERCWIFITVSAIIGFIVLLHSLPSIPQIYPPLPSHSNSRLLPFKYWQDRSVNPACYPNLSCMKFPSISDLKYATNDWQLLEVENGSVYIYGAYWDDRFEESLVRILVYSDVMPLPKLYCQLWYPNDNEPQVELADVTYGWNPAWGGPTGGVNEPYILSCRARRHDPEPELAPAAVAVVTRACGVATNALAIQNAPFENTQAEITSRHNATSVAVCLKWLHFRQDISARLVEWLQLLKHFGAEKTYVYVVRVHPNTRKVLDYYQSIGFAVITEISHPPQISGVHFPRDRQDFLDMRRELLPLNDCLYRNLRTYDWLMAIDLDEIVVPETVDTWPELIDNITTASTSKGQSIDAIVFPNYYVLNDAQKDLVGPSYLPMLSHTWRARNPSPPGWYVKSFFNTSSVIAMHNHTPMSCKNSCYTRTMDKGPGRLLHYRDKCPADTPCEGLQDIVRDRILDKWRKTVIKEVDEILNKLGI